MTGIGTTSDNAPVLVRCARGRDMVRWLDSRHAHHPHVVALNPPACLRLEIHELAEAALDNMGHDASLTTAIRPAEVLAAAWLTARGVSDALFVDCQIHPLVRIRRAIDWLQALGIRPWLCVTRDEPNDLAVAGIEQLVAEYGGATIDERALRARFTDTAATVHESSVTLPSVPLVDVLAFRPTCRDLLAPAQFETVDAYFVSTVLQLRHALEASIAKARGRDARKLFRSVLEETANLDEFIIAARAIQAAALSCGINVRVDVPLLIGGECTIPRRGKLDAQAAWEQLARYRDPDVGAIAVLYGLGIDPDDLAEMTVDNLVVEPDDSVTVHTPVDTYRVSGERAVFLRALVRYRQLTAVTDSALLFHTHRAEQVRTSYLAATLTAPASEVGVELCTTPLRRQQLGDELWLTRHGIAVTVLGRHDAKQLKTKQLASQHRAKEEQTS